MKLRNLLVLGALLLAGSASAAIVDGVRQEPVLTDFAVETIEIDGASEYYMQNVGAGKFWVGANAWGTQASVGPTGWKVRFSQYVATEGEAWDGKTVLMEDYVKNSNWLKTWFVDNSNIMYTDFNNQPNYFWCIQKVGNYYRLSASALNPDAVVAGNAEKFVGINIEMGDSILYADLEEKPTTQIDWKFYSATSYESSLKVYELAQTMKGMIDDAKSKGFDATAQEAVYANEASTTEQINEAIAVLTEFLNNNVDPKNPMDKTIEITNPNYSDGKTGWNDTNSDWAVSYNVAEHYDDTYDHYQDITGLPSGLYAVKVRAYNRPSNSGTAYDYFLAGTPHKMFLYASSLDGTTEINTQNIWVGASDAALGVGSTSETVDASGKTIYVTNNMQGAEAYFNHEVYGPMYDATLYFYLSGDSVRIGVKQTEKVGADWALWDNWRLSYYGKSAEAYGVIVNTMVEAVINKFDGREAEMTVNLLDTYKAALNGLTATDIAGITAAQVTIDEAVSGVQTNIDGWVKYEQLIVYGNEVRNNPSYTSSTQMNQLAAYVARQAPAILKAKALSTEELLAEIAKLEQMITDAINASLPDNADVTEAYLVNADYSQGTTGWSGSWTAVAHGCMEAYECDWDAYQIVKNAVQGVYEVSLQGFYRVKRGQEAYDLYQNGGQTCPGHVYVNNHLTEVKCVFSEPVKHDEGYIFSAIGTGPESNPNAFIGPDGDSIFFANDMLTAGETFAAGMYVASANGIVANEGDELRLGVKGKKQTATWVIWDNFKMIYRGKQLEYTLPYLTEAIAAAEVTLTEPMAKDAKELLEAAKANAEAHLSSTDKEAVFAALVQIYAANDSVAASAELFANLKSAAEEIQNAMMIYESTATDAAMAAATDLLTQMLVGVEQSALTKEEAQALLAKKDQVLVDLILGNYQDASDDNPSDFTALLASPSFEDINGAGSAEGWTGADGALGSGAYEFYQKTFDLYQELTNIPNGTYRIEVSAYERIGASTDDYKTYKAAKDTATTYLYAGSAGDTIETKVARLASGAFLSNDAFGIEGCAKVDSLQNVELGADSLYWVANTMASAVTMFNDYGEYTNVYYVDVNDGTLRLGIKKDVQSTSDWVMMDNWKLFYHGTNSAYNIDDVVAGTDAAVVKREIFTLGGAKVGKLQPGVNIIRNIHADGTVTVMKVIK